MTDAEQIAQLRAERDAAIARAEAAEAALDEERHGGKYYVKARVYGAIAAEYGKALCCDAERGEARAQAALDWRYSDRGGVPWEAVVAIGDLLDAQRQRDELAAALDGLLGEARLCAKASAFRSPACLKEVICAAEEALEKVRGK